MLDGWLKSLKIYYDRRMLVMVLLGFASGFPLLLVFGTLSLWLKDSAVPLGMIGLFSLVKTPYSFKWLWSPIVDQIRLPFFSRFGRRRGWALFTQIWLFIAIIAMSTVDPAQAPITLAILAFLMVIASASQDIVLDAYRIENFSNREQGAGVGVFVLGYRMGALFSGAGALFLASIMSWGDVYKIMATGALVGMITILCSKEPAKSKKIKPKKIKGNWRQRLQKFMQIAVYNPFNDFINRPNWVLVLLFVFLYRMSDAYMGPMAYPFYDDMGFSKIEIASVTKIFGVIATIVGTLIGGLVVSRMGIVKSLMFCGVLQGLSNLVFVAQAYAGYNVSMLMFTISVENISGGMGTAAFVAYLSSLCNVSYTATQYALLSSLMSLARDVFAATSGFLAMSVSWSVFFVITTFMAVPGLALLIYLTRIQHIKNN